MARRLEQENVGPAVPRWVVQHDPVVFPDKGDWVAAVWDWVDVHLPGHPGPAYEIREQSFKSWMGAGHGA